MFGLPFDEVWALDFEFLAESGARPVPVCLVAKELGSGRLLRLWADELGPEPPFDVGPRSLFVAYMAAAEIGCFEVLGWQAPARVLDLYVEHKAKMNGRAAPSVSRGLLAALSHYGIPGITSDEKAAGRTLVMRDGPWTAEERKEVLDYCQTDVDALVPLLDCMLPGILRARPNRIGQALLRGRYMTAVARMENTGIPVDVKALGGLRAGWEDIKGDLVKEIDRDFGFYDGTTFKAGRFAAWLGHRHINWPRTPAGQLALDQDTFKDMSKAHPELEPVRELRHALGQMRLENLAVGPDGRNRTSLFPFSSVTGRNQPSNTKSIFGPSVWLRGLIKPPEGRAIAYIDWSAQEIAIAAVLSEDESLQAAIDSGDPYMAFAVMAGLAPAGATKETHPDIRKVCKVALLGTNYGMGPYRLASQTNTSEIEARRILRLLATTFPRYTEWADFQVDRCVLSGHVETLFGWPMHGCSSARRTALRNWPMQANGAEMLRLACCLATEDRIEVCAPVHDALLVEADADSLDDVVARTRAAMAEASAAVLKGREVGTDVDIVRYPDRYADPRGKVMWDRVSGLLRGRGYEGW